jgi:hypothetical protein
LAASSFLSNPNLSRIFVNKLIGLPFLSRDMYKGFSGKLAKIGEPNSQVDQRIPLGILPKNPCSQ